MGRKILSTISVLLLFTQLYASKIIETSKWETTNIVFQSKSLINNPFQVKLNCLFTNDENDTIKVHGFYNGKKHWIVRFTPNKTGVWKYLSFSSVKEMDGLSQLIHVKENNGSNHGSIEICKDISTRFCYEDGTPYHLMAFEADWLFALDYGNPELTKTKQLINSVRDNEFNQVVMNVYAFDAPWPKDEKLNPEYNYGGRLDIFPFKGNNENPDFSALNIDFFKHLDGVIELLAEKNIIAHLMIYVWNKEVNWPEAYSEADNLYFDYIVKRYQAYPNIIWDISKEALGYGHDDMNYISERIDRLNSLDAYNRLVTVHDYGYCSTYPEKVDFISVQTWKTNLYGEMINMYEKYPEKPVFNIEHGGYEEGPFTVFRGDYADAIACLRRNYYCAFAGVYSTYYWQGTSWYAIVHNPFGDNIVPNPKFHFYKYFYELLEQIEFHELVPSKENGTSGLCLLNEEKGIYVYYIPADNTSLIAQNLSEADSVSITWFNPLTGEYSDATKKKWRKGIRIEKKYTSQDEVAILKLNK